MSLQHLMCQKWSSLIDFYLLQVRTALGKALVRIHRNRREIQYIVLVSILSLVRECPSAFSPFLDDFFIKVRTPAIGQITCLFEITQFLLARHSLYV